MLTLSIVVPTYDEEQNVRPLVRQINEGLNGTDFEIIFIDDSRDRTPYIIAALMRDHDNIRMIHRQGKEREGGLATAVVRGFEAAEGRYVCRLDSDGQHPPKAVRELLQKALETQADLVIASRYIKGGSNGGLDGLVRRLVSTGSRWLAQIIFSETRGVSDLGEFYLFNREVLEGVSLYPGSFKIILSLLVQGHWRTIAETPYHFQKRHAGKSKASWKEGLIFLRHILQLLWRVPHSGRFWKFGLVGGLVALIGSALLYALVDLLGVEKNIAYFVQAVISLQLNFNLNDRFTWADRRQQRGYWSRWLKYHTARILSVVFNQILFALLTLLGVHYMLALVVGIVVAIALNYFMSDRFVFTSARRKEKEQ